MDGASFWRGGLPKIIINGDSQALREHLQFQRDSKEIRDDILGAFFTSAKRGQTECLKVFLEFGVDVNSTGPMDRTALMEASARGRVSCMEELIQNGAKVDQVDAVGETAFTLAAAKNQCVDVFRTLIAAGCDVNRVTLYKYDGLQRLISKGNIEAVKILLENGARQILETNPRKTALTTACERGHLNIVRYLIEHGATMNTLTRVHGTALGIAAKGGHAQVVACLLEAEADFMQQNCEGESPLLIACGSGQLETCQTLVYHARSREIDVSAEFLGCINAAAEGGHVDVMNFLIKEFSSLGVSGLIGSLNRALLHAAGRGLCCAIRLLIHCGAEVNFVCEDTGLTALLLAAKGDHLSTVQLLLDLGADINFVDKTGSSSALMLAVDAGGVSVVKCLLNRGADVTFKDSAGNTPLIRASTAGNDWIVSVLLEWPQDVNQKNTDGETALFCALKRWTRGTHFIISDLVKHGADVNVRAQNGLSVLEKAVLTVRRICSAAFPTKGPQPCELVFSLLEEKAEIGSALHLALYCGWIDDEGIVQRLVQHGAMPRIYNENNLDIKIRFQEPVVPTPFMLALTKNFSNIVYFFIHNMFLHEVDTHISKGSQFFTRYKTFDFKHLVSEIYSQPWTLESLCFIHISTRLGFDQCRESKVQQLPLPATYKKRLLFQDNSVNVPTEQWSSLGLSRIHGTTSVQ